MRKKGVPIVRGVFLRTFLLFLIVQSLFGCVTQLSDIRQEQSYFKAPEGTRIALLHIEIPLWVEQSLPEGVYPSTLLVPAIEEALLGSNYRLVDRRNTGFRLPVGPDREPVLLTSESLIAHLGMPYQIGPGNRGDAFGAPPLKWSVVSGPQGLRIDEATGEVHWIPQEVGEVSITLEVSNSYGSDRHTFRVQVVDDDSVEMVVRSPRRPAITEDQEFRGEFRFPPDSIAEPLLLMIAVNDWSEAMVPGLMEGTETKQIRADLVFSLWGRHGDHVETRRIGFEFVQNYRFKRPPRMAPPWPSYLRYNWENDNGYRPIMATSPANQLFETAADLAARAFFFPYGQRDIHFRSELMKAPGSEEGLELVEQRRWADAYESFQQGMDREGESSGIHFNLGIMAELMGDDNRAIEHYERAVELENRAMFRQRLHVTRFRNEGRRDLSNIVR